MKHVVITGSAGNLGKAVVKKFLEGGYHVIATVHSLVPVSIHPYLEYHAVNLTDESAVNNFFSEAIKKNTSIDAVVLLAGGYAGGSLEKTLSADLKKMFALNFETAFFPAQSAFSFMTKQGGGGKIILTGSRPGLLAASGKNMVAYALSKSLVFRLAEIINASGKEKNVSAHVIVPATIDTPQNRAAMPGANFSLWQKPEEIAEKLFEICQGGISNSVVEF